MKVRQVLGLILLAGIFCWMSYYTVYKNPLDADDVFYEEVFKNEKINVSQPDRYNVTLLEDETDIRFKGERLKMERLKEMSPYLYVQVKEEEGIQDLVVNVRGMDDYGYEIEKEKIQVDVQEAEKVEMDAKVVLRGETEKEIVAVEILDEIIGQYNDEIAENIKEVKVIIEIDGLEGTEEFKGEVVVVDEEDREIDRDILDTKEAKVRIVTRK